MDFKVTVAAVAFLKCMKKNSQHFCHKRVQNPKWNQAEICKNISLCKSLESELFLLKGQTEAEDSVSGISVSSAAVGLLQSATSCRRADSSGSSCVTVWRDSDDYSSSSGFCGFFCPVKRRRSPSDFGVRFLNVTARVMRALWKDGEDDGVLQMVVFSLWEVTARFHQPSDRKTSRKVWGSWKHRQGIKGQFQCNNINIHLHIIYSWSSFA